MVDRSGQRLGNYTLVKLVGEGGFAEVYLAEHQYLKSYAAIKILQAKLSGDDDMGSFLREAQTIARLSHPNIIRVMDFGVENETPYLVMDYAANGTLRQRHPRGSQVPLTTILPYVKQVSDALQYAHDEHLIHRDIKPENMLVGRRNEILLSDFGIALVAQSSRYQGTQDVVGTAAYMAPEQIQGKPRPASDQYSLGIVIYEWLTGDRPFHGTFTEMCTQHMFAAPEPLTIKVTGLPPAIEQVILRALEKDPHKRYPSMSEFSQAFEAAVGNIPMERTQRDPQSGDTYSTLLMSDTAHTIPSGTNGSGSGNSTQNTSIPNIGQTQSTSLPPTSLRMQPPILQSNTANHLQQPSEPAGAGQLGFLSNAGTNETLHSSATEMYTGSGTYPSTQGANPPSSANHMFPPYAQSLPASNQQPGISPTPHQFNYPQQPGQPGQGQNMYGPASQQPYNQQAAQSASPGYAAYAGRQLQYSQQQADPAKQPGYNGSGYKTNEPDSPTRQERENYPSASPAAREHEQPDKSSAVESDWFDLGSLGPWKWQVLGAILGLVLFCACYALKVPVRNKVYYTILVIPLFLGGAFGPIVGAIVGVAGALLAGAFYPGVEPYSQLFPAADYYRGLGWWQPWLFYGIAGVSSGLAMLGRRLPSIGSCIRSALLAIIILSIFIGFITFSSISKSSGATFLTRDIPILINVIISFAVLLIYSIVIRLISGNA